MVPLENKILAKSLSFRRNHLHGIYLQLHIVIQQQWSNHVFVELLVKKKRKFNKTPTLPHYFQVLQANGTEASELTHLVWTSTKFHTPHFYKLLD